MFHVNVLRQLTLRLFYITCQICASCFSAAGSTWFHVELPCGIAVLTAAAADCGHPQLIILTGFLHILELLDLHQDNIVSNLFHVAEGDHILLFPSKYTAKAPWSRYDQMGDTSGTRVKFHISNIPQPSAVADIDHFFFFKSKIRIVHT